MSGLSGLLPRCAPGAAGVSARGVLRLLDGLEGRGVECHSVMVVRGGRVVVEGWWAPYSAERGHLLYSLTKSFTSAAVGIAVGDGLLSLEDRVVDVLPESVPEGISEQGRRLNVHHLLTMTTGHGVDSLDGAWQAEPGDLAKGFLRGPFVEDEGTRHVYDNSTTFVLARMVERVTGVGLPEFLQERVFGPMGIEGAEWDRVASGAAFGFHGLHLTTEAIAAFGELLLRGGRWGDRQLVPREWVELATRPHVETLPLPGWSQNPDFLGGYGYQFWISRHGYHGHGSYGQYCVVVPKHDLVVVVTGAIQQEGALPGLLWECLLPGLDEPGNAEDEEILAGRLRQLSFAPAAGSAAPAGAGAAAPGRSGTADPGSVVARVDGSAEGSALADGTVVGVEPVSGGWRVRLGESVEVEVGYGEWRESSPLGRPAVASGAWQGDRFVADLFVITSPHRVRLEVNADAATATWNVVPLTTPDLELHLRTPLMTRPDVA
ncbi:serine hydrolase [Kribbella sp. NPDC026611]|uniref:serine hydrolase domain-containing protein n=1 Tax=Kribbella sp. NPDC026611 TaxID=3154911 RepID=UPI0033E84020